MAECGGVTITIRQVSHIEGPTVECLKYFKVLASECEQVRRENLIRYLDNSTRVYGEKKNGQWRETDDAERHGS